MMLFRGVFLLLVFLRVIASNTQCKINGPDQIRSWSFVGDSRDILGKETDKLARELEAAKIHLQSDAKLNYSLSFPVYYINLAKSKNRRRRIEESFSSIWDLHRVEAVDGKNAHLCQSLMGAENYRLIARLFPDDESAADPQVTSQSQGGRIHPSELGAILSHLTTIRRAYVEGFERVMIIEDDLSPYLMYVNRVAHKRPYWACSLEDLVAAMEKKNWGIIQLAWLNINGAQLYKSSSWRSENRPALIQRKFAYGAAAYLISREGMENVLKLFFDPRTSHDNVMDSKITPLLEGKLLTVEAYLGRVPDTFISMPSMFITEVEDTTIAEGNAFRASRLNAWRQSNKNHAKITLEMLLRRNNSLEDDEKEEKTTQIVDGHGRGSSGSSFVTLKSHLTKDEMGLDVALGETLNLLEEHRSRSSLNYSLPFPVYYLNEIEHSQLRRHMEETFGRIWDLRKVPKIHSTTPYQALLEKGTRFPLTHHDPSEMDRVLSHLYTIRKAYGDGDRIAMITEDNLSPLLMPYWTSSIADLIAMADEEQKEEGCPWSILVLGWTCGKPCLVYKKVTEASLPFRRLHQGERLWGDPESIDLRSYIISRAGMKKIIQHYFPDGRWLQRTSVTSTCFASLNHAFSMVSTSYVAVPSLFTYKIMEHHYAEGPFMWHSLSDFLRSTGLHAQKTIEVIDHLFEGENHGQDETEEDEV